MGVMTIYEPEIVHNEKKARLQATFDINGVKEIIWYEVHNQYQAYLTTERADAFVVGLLYLALQKGVNINVNAPMSKRLFYTLNKYYIPFLAELFGHNTIKINCDFLTSKQIANENGVGTGLSCGIDSFSTILDQMDSPEGYKITHVTFFNVGSHGDHGGPEAKRLFEKRLNHVQSCAAELGKDLLIVDSNLNEVLMTGYSKLHTIRSMSVVLALQGLFSVYYYSSAVPVKNFTTNKHHMGSYDVFSLSMLSTENVALLSSCTTLTRVEKTEMISKHPIAHKYLNVCAASNSNCGHCFKCLRTLLTLQILGNIQSFSSIFNMEAYYRGKYKYLTDIIAHHDKDIYWQEIHDAIIKYNFKIPLRVMFIGKLKKLKDRTKKRLLFWT